MRCGIDGLASVISDQYNLDLFSDAIFLFCGRKKDRYKALYWDRDGFMLLYKRIENGHLQWPKDQDEVKKLTSQELRWLLEGYLSNNLKPLNLLKQDIYTNRNKRFRQKSLISIFIFLKIRYTSCHDKPF